MYEILCASWLHGFMFIICETREFRKFISNVWKTRELPWAIAKLFDYLTWMCIVCSWCHTRQPVLVFVFRWKLRFSRFVLFCFILFSNLLWSEIQYAQPSAIKIINRKKKTFWFWIHYWEKVKSISDWPVNKDSQMK